MKIRNNRYIEKLLACSYSSEAPLSIDQIKWRMENKETIFALLVGGGLFRKATTLPLIRRTNGAFAILSPRDKKGISVFAYDINDVEAFLQKYSFVELDDTDDSDNDKIYAFLEQVKDTPGIGFIETLSDKPTRVFEAF